MSYASNDAAANDPTFRQQVRQSVYVQAANIVAESGGTTNHTLRSALATSVSGQLTDDRLTNYCRAVVSDGVTLPGASDATVLARVAVLWNQFAGGL